MAVACDMPPGERRTENVRWVLAVIKANAVAVASACLYHMIYGSNVLVYIYNIKYYSNLDSYPRLAENENECFSMK